jgi:tetratricopeptide (TPR) repeat protein
MKQTAHKIQKAAKTAVETADDIIDHEEAEHEASQPGVGGKIKYGFHCLLVVLTRLTEGLMSVYEKIFVVDKQVGTYEFNKDHGFGAFEKGDYPKAVKYFLLANEESERKDPEILFYLGLSYANQEEYEKAVDYLKESEKLKADDPDIISEIGGSLMKLERYEEALSYLRKAIELTPDVSNHHYSLGTACEKTGKLEDAIASYKRAIEIDPRDSVYYHALGFAYEASGKHVDAIACFKKAMELEKRGR